mmetsp:Transcript_40765/g.93841  ORF Transcript_40765/g.93841 Transcript_40765/m.93841 type:complete len:269 (-) Transcript_40765:43-849(-)
MIPAVGQVSRSSIVAACHRDGKWMEALSLGASDLCHDSTRRTTQQHRPRQWRHSYAIPSTASVLGMVAAWCSCSMARARSRPSQPCTRRSATGDGELVRQNQEGRGLPVDEGTSKADLMRQELWAMPSGTLEFQQEQVVRYRDKDRNYVVRNLVALKGRGSQKVIEKSARLLRNSTKLKRRVQYMDAIQKPHFGPQYAPFSEMNKDGLRAWKMRSGMRDQRFETEFRRPLQRPLDSKRKRKTFAKLGKKRKMRKLSGRQSGYSNRHRK